MTSPDKLIIFDYSGTLSLESPRFGRPENLIRTLQDTGLATLGVATPEFFWEQMVGPTWVEGSTTRAGYGRVLAERIASLPLSPRTPPLKIEAVVTRFVEAYLGQSWIDPLWQPILARLNGEGRSLQIVATDHYAEATAAIIGHLRALAIAAKPLGPGGGHAHPTADPRPSPGKRDAAFFVANSADLGTWKADRRFWEILRAQLPHRRFRGLLVVDDFGFNEEAGDLYGSPSKVTARQEKTLAVLREVFGVAADVFPFFLAREPRDSEADRARLIAGATDRIEGFLQ